MALSANAEQRVLGVRGADESLLVRFARLPILLFVLRGGGFFIRQISRTTAALSAYQSAAATSPRSDSDLQARDVMHKIDELTAIFAMTARTKRVKESLSKLYLRRVLVTGPEGKVRRGGRMRNFYFSVIS